MERLIVKIDDVTVAKAAIAFAEQLGLNVEPDALSKVFEGSYLTTGSKNYDVNWIKNDAFAVKKANESNVEITLLSEGGFGEFMDVCLSTYSENLEEDEVSLEDNAPSASVISALFTKVKSQKKSPAKYYLVLRNDSWVATTVSEGSYANLAEAYTSLN